MSEPFHNSVPRLSLRERLREAQTQVNDLAIQLHLTTIVAHFRGGEISLENASKALKMEPDNFRRANRVVDDEARRMLKDL